jgi:hypothetical protein
MRSEDREAKAEFIQAYFEDLDRRVMLLTRLDAADFPDEALLLCCCYIDGLAGSLYWPEEASARNFTKVLEQHGGEELLWHIHPKQLFEAFDSKKSLRSLASKIAGISGADDHRLRTADEVVAELSGNLTAGETGQLRREVWRGTLSQLVYTRIRCQLVHGLGATPLLLSQTTLRWQSVPALDFTLLHRALRRICTVAANRSITTNRWFGHDFREP